jgi:organizing structure protein 2
MAWERIKEATLNGRDQLSLGAVVAVEKIQEVTGLKLRETLGLEAKAIDVVDATERTVQEAKSAVEKKVEDVKVEIKEKAEDVKRLA